MIALRLAPVVLSFLVLAAHFLRSAQPALVVLTLALIALLAVRRPWAARTVQVALVLGAAEWARTLAALAAARAQAGLPSARMIVILGSVACLTALSALVFRAARVKEWYGMKGR